MVILTWFAIIGGIYTLFAIAGDGLNPHIRKDLSHWLLRLDPSRPVVNWAESFATIVDRVFGEKHLSIRCFLRSCVASILAVTTMTMLLFSSQTTSFASWTPSASLFGNLLLVGVFANVIPDYLSLLESRYIIKILRGKPSFLRILSLLIADLLATPMIFVLFVLMVFMSSLMGDILSEAARIIKWFYFHGDDWRDKVETIILYYSSGSPTFMNDFPSIEAFTHLSNSEPELNGILAIYFYSTFFTSIWIWLFLASSMLIRLSLSLSHGLSWLKTLLNIDEKPVHSMGLVSCLLASVLYWGWVAVR